MIAVLALGSALGVMFLGLVVLSRLENQAARCAQYQALARQNAKVGLLLAVAQLQKQAGLDERLTSSAAITGSALGGNSYWTGVWNAQAIDEPPVWLVSGDGPSPAQSVLEGSPILVSAATLGEDTIPSVQAPLVTVTDAEGVVTGGYAYWTGDEGTKTSAGRYDFTTSPINYTTDAQCQLLRQELAPNVGIETIFPDIDPALPAARAGIERRSCN